MSSWNALRQETATRLESRAAAELELRRRRRARLPLLDFVQALSPRYERPEHLSAISEVLERSEHEPVRACVSVPPRHGKTEILLHAIAQRLARRPQDVIAYASYAAEFAHSKSKTARDYALRAGARLRADTTSAAEWRTTDGGGLIATGIGGQLTGRGCQLLIIDDPHKSRAEAESHAIRSGVFDWFQGTAATRVEPGGSIVVVHTRWHPDDLIGTLRADKNTKWDVINRPAIDDAGRALWPERWPVDALLSRRALVAEYEWASQYQGQPQPRGAHVFEGTFFYEEPPRHGYRIGIGIDLAYSARTKSDFSTAVVLLESQGYYYVVECVRVQQHAPDFAQTLALVRKRYGAACIPRWYCSGTEIGVADMIGDIDAHVTHADKFVRSQRASSAWNAGTILLPRCERPNALGREWLRDLSEEVLRFTGMGDAHDDIVDALVAAFDSLHREAPQEYFALHEASGW